MKYEVLINGARRSLEFALPAPGATRPAATIDGRPVDADVIRVSPHVYSVLIGGRSIEVTLEERRTGFLGRANGREFQIEIIDPRSWSSARGAGVELEGRQQLLAPMPGKIVRLLAAVGQQVTTGQGLLVIEAMKMQNEVRSPKSGRLEKLAIEGQTVNAGEILAVVV
jgi:biotin carboxyl carrier protein